MSGRHPTRDDRALWRRSMRDVTPLAPERAARPPEEDEPTVEPARPRLNVVRSGSQLVITWDSSAQFQLQSKPALSSGSWTAVSQSEVVNGTSHTVHVPLGGQSKFYRLQSP